MPSMPPITRAPNEFREDARQIILSDSAFRDAATPYVEFLLAPPILARRLRARGDDRARSRDFECICPTAQDSDRPRCMEIFADCRFANDPERDKPPGVSPRRTLIYDLLIDIAYAYEKASATTKADMLAFMTKAIESHIRRRLRRRLAGKYFRDASRASSRESAASDR